MNVTSKVAGKNAIPVVYLERHPRGVFGTPSPKCIWNVIPVVYLERHPRGYLIGDLVQ
jgi:hypothetical protein